MRNQEDRPGKDGVADRLRALVTDISYTRGDRLPAERELIDLLRVGYAALRRALDHLKRDGMICRHVGKRAFIANGAANINSQHDPFAGICKHLTAFRMMRARITIEPVIAREAEVNASCASVAHFRAKLQHCRAA